MANAPQIESEQEKLWNGPSGEVWVDAQETLDQMFLPFRDMLVDAIAAGSGAQALDVGCGAGAVTLAAARRLGETGRSVGVDISAPLVAAARTRAERERAPANFIRANAETYAFEPASFDMILSRFGVMFFEDSVRAFANLRRAAKQNAALRFIAWRSPAENPFMTTAERAAAPLLPNLPARQPGAPGQFAFADQRRVFTILKDSGWMEIDIQPVDVVCGLPEKELARYVSRMGSVGAFLREADDRTRAHVIETVRAAFNPYVSGDAVRFTAACWLVNARAPASI